MGAGKNSTQSHHNTLSDHKERAAGRQKELGRDRPTRDDMEEPVRGETKGATGNPDPAKEE